MKAPTRLKQDKKVSKVKLKDSAQSTPKACAQAQAPGSSAWIDSLQLSQTAGEQLKTELQRVSSLALVDKSAVMDLLAFQHSQLPALHDKFEQDGDFQRQMLCRLFAVFMRMVLQGFSLFPQNPTQLAQQIKDALLSPTVSFKPFEALVELLIDPKTGQPLSGLNSIDIADPDFVIESEHERRQGLHEGGWKAPFKFTQLEASVRDDPRFHSDWKTIKRLFPVDSFRDADGIIRRSKLEEGSWRRPIDSNLSDLKNQFQVVFDFFCWKWFVYAMHHDKPLVQKLACNLTPYGTLIFIPGYWSLDPHRDINWRRVMRLHRARGIERQGQKLASDKKERLNQLKKLLQANRDAQQQNLRGQARYLFLKKQAGFIPETDDAHIRRLLRQARQK